MYGPFRLIPFGYAKALRYEELVEVTESTGVELTRDPATVRQSSLFAEPSFLPAGYTLKELSGEGRGDAETEVFLRFERPGNEITISRTRITVTPLDVHLFSPDAGVAVQAGNVGRAPAVFIHPQPGNSVPLPVIVAFAKDGIYTIVTARGFTEQQPAPPLEEVIKIAESIL